MAVGNVVAMSLRMRNTAARTAKDLKHEVKGVGTEAQKMGTKFGHAVKATRTSVGGLAGSLVSLRTVIAATFIYRGLQRFGDFLKSLTTLYKEQEVATRILGESLAGWGNYSEELVTQLHNQAMAMQEVTNIDNEEIESMMALLASYGMVGDQIKEVIGLVLDLSKAKRIELKAATDLVGKAFVGYTGTLSRYGIIIEKNLTLEEKYAAMLKKITAYRGVAAGVAETYAGQVGILGKLYDDMKKQMGAIIAHGYVQSGMFESLSERVKNTHDWFVKWDPVLSHFAENAMEDFKNKLLEVTLIMEEGNLPRWLFTIGNSITIVTRAFTVFFRVVGEGLNNITGALRLGIKNFMIFVTLVKEGVRAAIEARDLLRQDLDKYMDDVWDQRQKGLLKNEETIKNLQKDFKDLKEIWEPATGRDFIDQLTEKMEKLRLELVAEREKMKDTDNVLAQNIQNRRMLNDVVEETIKLTKTMASQYALATRVEQAQIKYLLDKSKELKIADIGGLTDLEKKLIRAQGVLREFYEPLLSEFAAIKLGIEVEDPAALEKMLKKRNLMEESLRLRKEAGVSEAEGATELEKLQNMAKEKSLLKESITLIKAKLALQGEAKHEDPEIAKIMEEEKNTLAANLALYEKKSRLLEEQLEAARQLAREDLSPSQERVLSIAQGLMDKTRSTYDTMVRKTEEMQKQVEFLEQQIEKEEEIESSMGRQRRLLEESRVPTLWEQIQKEGFFHTQYYAPMPGRPDTYEPRFSFDRLERRAWDAGRRVVKIDLTGAASRVFRIIEDHYGPSRKASFERAD
ncbi:MAG: hypothetical protein ACXABY_16000 [Candidatus Thorarchaeota archaeon]|jgi:hypothetical protein